MSAAPRSSPDEPGDGQRIDKWLWFARFYKTRALAAKAVRAGHIRINGARAKPGHDVRPGDQIELVKEQLRWRLTAGPLPSRRGPAKEARLCYAEDEASVERRQKMIANLRMDRLQMPRTDGRPDKHTRRKLRARRHNE